MSKQEKSTTEPSYLAAHEGLGSWFTSTDHKRIGVMYLVGIIVAFLLGGLFALGLRMELLGADKNMVDPETYNRMFTVHGAVMVFLVIVPGIPATLGNFLVPMLLGARRLCFPRLNLAAFYSWLVGGVLLLVFLFVGNLDTGWTLSVPYSLSEDLSTTTQLVPALVGILLIGLSSILTGFNFVATIVRRRAPGLSWFNMPLMLWGILWAGIVQIVASPVLLIAMVMLCMDSSGSSTYFNWKEGGDPVLFQNLFWFYAHPAVYIMLVPAMAIVSEIISTFARKRIFGYKYMVFSGMALAVLALLAWGQNMFVSGQARTTSLVFSAFAVAFVVPALVKIFNWIATLYKGSIELRAPMLYALAFVLLLTIGLFSGLFLAAMSTNVHLHDTYFATGHFHYIVMGAVLVAFLGGLHYWWPKMFGRMYNDKVAQILAIVLFVSFNLAFLPHLILGAQGLPSRSVYYDARFETLQMMSTAGSVILGLTLVGAFVVLFLSLVKGEAAADNPWGATTLEWQSSSPPPVGNFASDMDAPTIYPVYDYEGLKGDSSAGGYVRSE